MRTRHVLTIGAALIALSGCSAQKPAAAPPAPSAGPQPSASVDAETLEATAAYLSELGKIDKKLTSNTRAALDNGMESCVDLEERRTDAELQKNVATRFSVDPAQAKKILAVTKASLCLE